jgi:hypothetical protein
VESVSFDPLRTSTSRGTPRSFNRSDSHYMISPRFQTCENLHIYIFYDVLYSPRRVHVEYFSDVLLRPVGSYPFEDLYRKHFNSAHSETFQVCDTRVIRLLYNFTTHLGRDCCQSVALIYSTDFLLLPLHSLLLTIPSISQTEKKEATILLKSFHSLCSAQANSPKAIQSLLKMGLEMRCEYVVFPLMILISSLEI